MRESEEYQGVGWRVDGKLLGGNTKVAEPLQDQLTT